MSIFSSDTALLTNEKPNNSGIGFRNYMQKKLQSENYDHEGKEYKVKYTKTALTVSINKSETTFG